jgi:hypothetical protein
MKNLIKDILSQKGIDIKKEESNDNYQMIFTSYNQPIDDFFSIIFIDAEKLILEEKIEGTDELVSPEDFINSLLLELRNEKENKEYNLKNNFSCIVAIDSTNCNYLSQKIKRIEDDKFYAKKYVLKYNNQDLTNLKDKIKKQETQGLIDSFSKILNDYDFLSQGKNEELKTDKNKWYLLLLEMYIKIPFLNYSVFESDSMLNLSSTINQKLEKLENNTALGEMDELLESNDLSDEQFENKLTSIIGEDEE